MKVANYRGQIAEYTEVLKAFRRSASLFGRESELLELMKGRYELYYAQIHEWLAPKGTVEAEAEIREHIKDIHRYDLPVCVAKIEAFQRSVEIYEKRKDKANTDLCYKYLQEWLTLYEDNYALVAFRSLEHFALFSEWDKADKDKFWKYSIDTFGDGGYKGCTKGFFYYGNQMVLDNKIKFMLKRMPTSFGKCGHPDTKVRTPKGITTLRDIQVGDELYSMKDNKLCVEHVNNKWYSKKKQVKVITRGGVEIIVSPEHKLYTQKGYIKAEDLTCDDYLYRLCTSIDCKEFKRKLVGQFNADTGLLNDIIYHDFVYDKIKKIELSDEEIDMIDIEVSNTHNFIANDIVSHNSFSDSVMIAFIFGVDRGEQVIKVVGNKSLPKKCTKQVVDIMCSERYRQVFPEYAKYVSPESKLDVAMQIFSNCSINDGIFTIRDSGRDTSYESFSKETKRDGIRGGWLFLDDIVQRKEIMNLKQHEEDLQDFDGTWKKRSRDENTFRIVCGGTSYDCNDLLQVLMYRYSGGKVKRSPINKYTTLNMDESAVFVTVTKLDENDKPTFPQKTVLKTILEDRHNNPKLFEAMDMQNPVAPDDTPFYWDYIRQYEFIPSENCTEYSYAALDPARTGDNYISMPICKVVKEIDPDGTVVERHYLIDCLYLKRAMDTVYGFICDLIEKYHIIKLHIERNTDTSLKYLLDKMLKERDVAYCEISEVYSTKKKEDRIYADETAIKNKMVFPKREMYSRASQIGQFMEHVIAYKYSGAAYDDSIDSVSLYVDKFVNSETKNSKAKLLYL